ncbi:hypothetical protein P9112_004208 [Eukaryota sp. TZLM1-RC]
MSMSRHSNILCLHGYRSDGKSFSNRTGSLRKPSRSFTNFIFIDAPHVVDESSPTACYGWWQRDGDDLCGLEASIKYVLNYIATSDVPIDGLLGFSQGAAIVAIISTLLSTDVRSPGFVFVNTSIKSVIRKPSFYLIFSGFLPYFDAFKDNTDIFESALKSSFPLSPSSLGKTGKSTSSSTAVPIHLKGELDSGQAVDVRTFHCYGLGDEQVPADASRVLTRCFANPFVIYHEGGHYIPSVVKGEVKNFLKQFVF